MMERVWSHLLSGRWLRLIKAFHRIRAASEFANETEKTVGSAGQGVPLFWKVALIAVESYSSLGKILVVPELEVSLLGSVLALPRLGYRRYELSPSP
jgi:hypothetical protein